ncbi:MAG: ABC transporter substrate-binding protein [Bacteroidota bacterium]
MNLDAGLTSLDPAYARSRSPIWMTAQIFNGLVRLDSNLIVRPAVAKSWDLSDDGKTYTFHLRQGIKYHHHPVFFDQYQYADSSRELVAQDFVYSLSRILDPEVASTGKWVFNGKIEGIEAYKNGESENISGFRAIDDTTFQIRLLKPFPPFLGLLSMPYCYAIPHEIAEHYGRDFQRNPIGTGPFQFYRWKEGQSLILHRNPNYWEQDVLGQSLPYLDAVKVRFIPSRLSAFIEFVHGKLDFIGDLDDSYRDEVLERDGTIKAAYAEKYQFLFSPQLNTEYLGIQTDPKLDITQDHPLMDVKIRKALNYAIDRPKLVRFLLNGMGYPAESGFMPKGLPAFDPVAVQGYTYDPLRARELLQEAGYPNGKGLEQIVLYSTQKYAAISEFIQKSFEQIGVRTEIQNLDGGTLRSDRDGLRINFWRASWIADYPDGENYLSLYWSGNFSPDGPNTSHFASAEYDALYEASLKQTTDSLRYLLYHEMERLMLAQAPIIPLYYDRSFRMLQANVSGLGTNPMNYLSLMYVKKEKISDN